MAFYEGAAMRLQIDTKDIFHEVDCELSFSTDFKEVASKDTDGKISTPGSQSFSGSVNMSLVDNDVTKNDLKTIADAWKAKALHPFTLASGTSGNLVVSGNIYISDFNISAVNEEKVTASFSIKGSGDPTFANEA